MPSMLVKVNISKGFKTWTDMVKSMEEKLELKEQSRFELVPILMRLQST